MSSNYIQLAIESIKPMATNRVFTLGQRIAISQGFWVQMGEHPAQPRCGVGYPFRFTQQGEFWDIGCRLAIAFCEKHGL